MRDSSINAIIDGVINPDFFSLQQLEFFPDLPVIPIEGDSNRAWNAIANRAFTMRVFPFSPATIIKDDKTRPLRFRADSDFRGVLASL